MENIPEHAHIVYIPLPSHVKKANNTQGNAERTDSTKKSDNTDKAKPADANLRAENEDDDGYDPYSDYHKPDEFFERNPWD